jgi:hypothetical protein
MQQTIFATVALAVVIVGLSEPTYALTRDDCQRAGGGRGTEQSFAGLQVLLRV